MSICMPRWFLGIVGTNAVVLCILQTIFKWQTCTIILLSIFAVFYDIAKGLRMLVTIMKQSAFFGFCAAAAFGSLLYEVFVPTHKPMQCHESKTYNVRSVCECALICRTEPNTCAGYILTQNYTTSCDICFIYDVYYSHTALWTINASCNMFLPLISKAEGKLSTMNIYPCIGLFSNYCLHKCFIWSQ